MGLATHLGPWLLGTVKNTSTTPAGVTVYRNTGATTVGQFINIDASVSLTGTLGYVPAGALITSVYMYTTSAFAGTPSVIVSIAGVPVTTNPSYNSGVFNGTLPYAQLATPAGTLANVGSTDAAVTYTVSGSGTTSGKATIMVEYMLRSSDGTAAPITA